jgi:hypothetical protein
MNARSRSQTHYGKVCAVTGVIGQLKMMDRVVNARLAVSNGRSWWQHKLAPLQDEDLHGRI